MTNWYKVAQNYNEKPTEKAKKLLDYTQITDNIYIGEAPWEANLDTLNDLGITAVLAFDILDENEAEELRKRGIDYKAIFFTDFGVPNQTQLAEAISYINRVLSSSGKIYIHCLGGIGRSPLVLYMYFLGVGINPVKAMQLIKKRFLDLSDGQIDYIIWSLRKAGHNQNIIQQVFDGLYNPIEYKEKHSAW